MVWVKYEGTEERYTSLQSLGYEVLTDLDTGTMRVTLGSNSNPDVLTPSGVTSSTIFDDVQAKGYWYDYNGADPYYVGLQKDGFTVQQDRVSGYIRVNGKIITDYEYYKATGKMPSVSKYYDAPGPSTADLGMETGTDITKTWRAYNGGDLNLLGLMEDGVDVLQNGATDEIMVNGKIWTPVDYYDEFGKFPGKVTWAQLDEGGEWPSLRSLLLQADAERMQSATTYSNIEGKSFSRAIWEKFKTKLPSYEWGVGIVDAGLFLLAYEMEAVSFTEYLYYEAVRWGTRLLKVIYLHKDTTLLRYFADKIYRNVWAPAYSFHLAWGPLNPFSFDGYEVVYRFYWNEILKYTGNYFDNAFGFRASEYKTDSKTGSETINDYHTNGTQAE